MRITLVKSATLLLFAAPFVQGQNALPHPVNKSKRMTKTNNNHYRGLTKGVQSPKIDVTAKHTTMNDNFNTGASTILSSVIRAGKQAFVLSPNEIMINAVQFTILLATMCLVRIPSIDHLIVNFFQGFPHEVMHSYEPLSVMNWIIHYSSLAYNVGVILGLLAMDKSNNDNASDSKGNLFAKRGRTFAIAVSGVGQVLGFSLLVSHSLVGTGSPAEQALYNFSNSLIKFSAMSLGGLMLLPKVCSIPVALLVAWSIVMEMVTFKNVIGIALANIGLAAVLASPKKDFPMKFKIGYIMMSFIPVVSAIVDKSIGGGTDLGHSLGAAWLTLSTIVQRWAWVS